MNPFLFYAVAWLGMVVLAILNGAIREKCYGPRMGELAAHQLSTMIGIAMFAAYIWVVTGFGGIASFQQAWQIGGMWVVMTVLFEFLFGRYAVGHSWRHLFADYNLFKGRVWALVLLWVLVAPPLCVYLRQ